MTWDGSHRGAARVARGDKRIPVEVHQGRHKPTATVGERLWHATNKKTHQVKQDLGLYKPKKKDMGKPSKAPGLYKKVANLRQAKESHRSSDGAKWGTSHGPTKAALRSKQKLVGGAAVALTGAGIAVKMTEDDKRKIRKALSQEQIDRRKRIQATTSITTGTLGLAGLGAMSLAHPRANKALVSAAKKVPGGKRLALRLKPKALERVRNRALTAGAGIGGIGAYNFASYTRGEAEQKKKAASR